MQNSDRVKKDLRTFLNMVQQQLPVPEVDSEWPPEVRNTVPYIHQHIFKKELKVAKLREVVYGCNGNHFSTDFSYHLGTPPSVYINDLRIETAKRVLSEKRFSDISILMIAIELGFSGKGNFHHAFRERVGVTPGKWRKRELSKAGRTEKK